LGAITTNRWASLGSALPLNGALVGRVRERRLLEGLLESVDGGGAAAAVVGEAGVGKTAMLAHVADVASRGGMRVMRARGEESEAVLAFAALADLLLPLREKFGELPQAQRQALEVCLALSSGPAAGPLAACAGALGVLASAADDKPLAVLVDDFQWVDPESQRILLFAARRLATEPIVMILAARDGPGAEVPTYGLPTLKIGGLSVAECAELARRLSIDISGPVLRSLVGQTGGNPLAVLENLAGADNGMGGVEPRRLTLAASLERAWSRAFEELPDDTRHALYVIAIDGVSGGRHIAAALRTLRLSLGSLAPAERRGLLQTVDGEIQLRHPLLRSVIIARTPLATRVAAYTALAKAADGYLRTWYLAAAATGPDEAVASALVTASSNARERNGFGASARILRRAAELTEGSLLRAQRLLQAAQDAQLAGDAQTAISWCQEALKHRHDPAFTVDVELVAGRARTWMGDISRAFDGMVRAADMARQVDATRAVLILAEATAPAAMQGHVHLVRKVAEQVEDIWNESAKVAAAATPTVLALIAESFVMSGELHRAEPYLHRIANLLPSSQMTEMQAAAFFAQSLNWVERYTEARRHLAPVVDAGRRMASPSTLSFALTLSAEIAWWTGHWAAAYADVTEALQWSEEHTQPGLTGYSLSLLARVAAGRGDREACEAHVDRIQREVQPHGVGCMPVYGRAAIGLAALGAGDLATAIDNLEHAWELGCREGWGNPNVVPMAGDLAEALARAREIDRCRDVVSWLDERAQATGLAYPRSTACRARGIMSAGADEAQRWFAESIACFGTIGPIPFEEARTLQCSGEALRRARRPAAARQPLQRALTMFDGLGARTWSARASAELAASGAKDSRPGPASAAGRGLDQLSPQELQVACAAGRGLNNNEVAAVLFVSRKTVEAHLTRVYRKLAVRSRTELALVLHANGLLG
jgi:DNA-binding CsgD family transcriptional regulator/tetratricopeptide (TPR) repeat protein